MTDQTPTTPAPAASPVITAELSIRIAPDGRIELVATMARVAAVDLALLIVGSSQHAAWKRS